MHHHTIQIIQPTRCNSFTSLLLDIYVRLTNCTRSLWFYRRRAAAGALLVVVWQVNLPDLLLVQLYAPDDGRGDPKTC